MKQTLFLARSLFATLILAAASLGCEEESARVAPDDKPAPEKAKPAAPQDTKQEKEPAATRKQLAPNIFLETQGKKKRVLVSSTVVLRSGALELLLCKKNTKEHESILATDLDAKMLKAALLATGAQEGSTVEYDPKYKAASGGVIKVTLEYEKNGKVISAPAQEWIRDGDKKPLKADWVFAGSKLIKNPFDANKPIFLADDGDLICVSNFESALLDLPIMSSKANSELVWECNTDKIPPLETKVLVIFEPTGEKK